MEIERNSSVMRHEKSANYAGNCNEMWEAVNREYKYVVDCGGRKLEISLVGEENGRMVILRNTGDKRKGISFHEWNFRTDGTDGILKLK